MASLSVCFLSFRVLQSPRAFFMFLDSSCWQLCNGWPVCVSTHLFGPLLVWTPLIKLVYMWVVGEVIFIFVMHYPLFFSWKNCVTLFKVWQSFIDVVLELNGAHSLQKPACFLPVSFLKDIQWCILMYQRIINSWRMSIASVLRFWIYWL